MWKEWKMMVKGKWKILLFIEAALLAAAVIGIARGEKPVVDTSGMAVSQCAGARTEDGWYIDETAAFNGEYLTAAGFDLKPGVYELNLYYEAMDDIAGSYEITGGEAYYNSLLSNAVSLYSGESVSSLQFYVLDGTDKLRIAVHYTGTKGLTVKGFSIVHTTAGARMLLVCTVFFSLLFNSIICLYRYLGSHKVPKEKLLPVFGIPALAVLASVPLFTNYMTLGADAIFHWLRIEALAESLRSFEIPVRIESMWLFGHGYASSIFYGDTFLVLPALLRLLGFPVIIAYGAYVFAVNLATAGISYISFKGCFRDCRVGMAGSMLYTLAPYRIYNIYNRNAVGEYTAMAFLPLLCYGFYLIFTEDTEKKAYRYYWMIPVLGFSGVIQCHVLSCEIVGVFAILLCVIMIKRVLRGRTFVELCKVVAGTVLLNLWFLLPLLDMMSAGEYRYMNNTGVTIQNRGIMPAHIFYTMQRAGKNSRFQELGMYETEPFSVGAAILLGVTVFFILRARDGKKESTVYQKAGIAAFLVGGAGLVMSTCYFPWDSIQGLNRITGTLVPIIQFPTRLTIIPTVCMTFVACAACAEILRRGQGALQKGFFTLLCSSCILFSLYQTNDILLQEDEIIRIHSAQGMGHSNTLGGEYLPRYEEVDFRFHGAEGSEGVAVEDFRKENLNTYTTLEASGNDGTYQVRLPMLYYKGYRAEDNETGEKFEVVSGRNGDVTVLLPAGYRGTLHTWYAGMWYWRLAEAVSFCTAAGMIYAALRFRKKFPPFSENILLKS